MLFITKTRSPNPSLKLRASLKLDASNSFLRNQYQSVLLQELGWRLPPRLLPGQVAPQKSWVLPQIFELRPHRQSLPGELRKQRQIISFQEIVLLQHFWAPGSSSIPQ